MKHIVVSCFLFLAVGIIRAQTYGNEWIAYNQQYLKMAVTTDGLYRIDFTALDAALSAIGEDLASIDPRNFQLFNKGIEQHIFIAGEADGNFDPSDFIEFYGRRNDGTSDTPLFDSAHFQLHQFESIITDTAIYFLTWNNLTDNARMTNLLNDLSGAPAAQTYFIHHSRIVFGSGYGSANFNAGPTYLEVNSSKYEMGEGFTSPKYSLSAYNITLNTPAYYAAAPVTPTLDAVAIGTNTSEHHVVMGFNGTTLYDTTFTNYKVVRIHEALASLLASNTVSFTSGPLSTDYQRYSYVDIMYPRQFDFDNASRFQCTIDEVAGGTTYLELTDFDEKGTSPVLYDLTNNRRMVGIVEADISKFHLPFNMTDHNMFVTSQDVTDIKPAPALKPVQFVDYTDVAEQGNYLIISNRILFDDGFGENHVQAYADYRSSAAGGGYTARVVDIDVLYDEFYYGLRKHPLAIRNFIEYAHDTFEDSVRYVFVIGKSYSYDLTRANGAFEYAEDLVPTFGSPGSDALLGAPQNDVVHLIPLGRITARNGNDVRVYLDKVIDYEAYQADLTQTVANKLWMKKALHFAGGLTSFEQSLFNNFLAQYATKLEDTLYGGHVTQFSKFSTDPIYYSENDYIDSLIAEGVSLITFFGHSSTGSFDYNIGDPEDFTNEGKYFTVYGNGCNIAAIHGETYTLGERYIFAEDRAAVAFVAAANFSLASSLNTYASKFYDEFGKFSYNQSVGDAIQHTADVLWPAINVYDRMTIENTTLQGDPALRLNTHPKPDYAIEAPYVSFVPEVISPGIDTFYVQLIVSNLGMAIDSTCYIEVKRINGGGTESVYFERHHTVYYQDTILIPFATGGSDAVGLNSFTIHIDKENEIPELDEFNNIIGAEVLIVSDDAFPIYPVEFSIMTAEPEYFAASTSYVFATEKNFLIEADTTMLFNSPLRRSTEVVESGGVVYWQDPPMTWIPNTVYYWRITPDTADGSAPLWRSSSFLYLPGDIKGWNQSHYYQYQEDKFGNIVLQPDRAFEFVPDVVTYQVATGIYPTTHWTQVTSYMNGELLSVGSCASAGFVVIVADANSGQPWRTHEVGTSNTGPYGDVYCSADPYERMIQFNTNTPESREILYHFMMDSVPDSSYFICYTNNYAEFNTWMGDELIYGHTLFDAFDAYGAVDIHSLEVFDADRSYIFSAKKGDPATKVEIISDEFGNKIESVVVVSGYWYSGYVQSPIIGPAYSWDKAEWSTFANDDPSSDVMKVTIIGLDTLGNEVNLETGLISGDTTLSWINAELYPNIRIHMDAFDDSLRTPQQFNYWRVIYDPVPEAALNPNVNFAFFNDTLAQGQPGNISIAVSNVSDYDMDSILIQFQVRDAANNLMSVPYARQDSLLSDSTRIVQLTFNTTTIPAGNNTLQITVNPNKDQPEQFSFNNYASIPFYIDPDVHDPVLDVTFDDIHILDGDIVSAKPEIQILLRDENIWLAMNDSTLLEIDIEYPDGSNHAYPFDGVTTIFYPADTSGLESDNAARVMMFPEFDQDGTYILKLHGKDRTGNKAGNIDYRISFEVINKAMISNVFNYPNPFSTQTRFVFTVTGSEVPDYFKIQIMTISGKVVREIMRSELGELHIGNNITEFAWDGRDQYGDLLANGLYLYRVVTRVQGETPEHFDTNTDQFFESGYGKLYIAR